MWVVPVVFRKYVFSLRNVENDRSLVHIVTGRVNKMVINVNMLGKASGHFQHLVWLFQLVWLFCVHVVRVASTRCLFNIFFSLVFIGSIATFFAIEIQQSFFSFLHLRHYQFSILYFINFPTKPFS